MNDPYGGRPPFVAGSDTSEEAADSVELLGARRRGAYKEEAYGVRRRGRGWLGSAQTARPEGELVLGSREGKRRPTQGRQTIWRESVKDGGGYAQTVLL